MAARLVASSLTFKKCTFEKLAFILLNVLDLGLTVFAVSNGAHELNPLMRAAFASPFQLLMIKLVIPVFLAWLIPGKLLLPAIALLAFVAGWNIKELLPIP